MNVIGRGSGGRGGKEFVEVCVVGKGGRDFSNGNGSEYVSV